MWTCFDSYFVILAALNHLEFMCLYSLTFQGQMQNSYLLQKKRDRRHSKHSITRCGNFFPSYVGYSSLLLLVFERIDLSRVTTEKQMSYQDA